MPSPLEIIRSQRGRGGGGPLDIIRAARGRTTRRGQSLPDLQQRSAELEALQQATGAPEVEQDRPGVFRTLIDLLSRPNFAIAGFAEELLDETPSVTQGAKRALTEIFSGVGGLRGEKRAFGEVLERLGVGTTTLADAFPALEGTWVGNFGSRGAAGLALDIATDPLTYMTFGAGTGIKIAAKQGTRYLNKAGNDAFLTILQKHRKAGMDVLGDAADPTAVDRMFTKTLAAAEDEFSDAFAKGPGKDIISEFLEPGGAKLFGKQIPGTADLPNPIRKAVEMLPEGVSRPVIEGASQMKEGMLRTVRGLFSPEGALANLPEPLRTRAVRLTNDFHRSSVAHRAHLMGQMSKFERTYRKIARRDPGIGERWHDVREGVKDLSAITDPDELASYAGTMDLYDNMGQTLVDHGILSPEQYRDGYIFHRYQNIEDLAQYHPNKTGRGAPGAGNTITKERVFNTTRDAQDITSQLHRESLELMSSGEARRLYPELVPEYDVFKNMKAYIGKHTDLVARTAWKEELASQFGRRLDELVDFDAVYGDIPGVANPPKGQRPRGGFAFPKAGAAVSGLHVRHHVPNTSSISASFNDFEVLPGVREVRFRDFEAPPASTARTRELADQIKRSGEVNPLIVVEDPDGLYVLEGAHRWDALQELGHDTFPAVVVRDLDDIGKRGAPKGFTPENVPLRRVIQEGDIEKELADKFGPEGAQYIAVKSKLTGDETVFLPREIVKQLESVNASLFNTKDYPAFAKLLRGFDWLNNNFKWGVYTIWPASATRDAYSNVALSMLRVGTAALDPKRHIDAVALMAGRAKDLGKEFAGSGYTLGQLRDLSKSFGVWVPGQVFVEQTGRFKLGKFRRALTEKRAGIENEARVMLWLEEIRRGADPRLAADTVGEFLFNYGEVSRVERDLFRRLIPFYTFTRKNIELQWKMLRRNPGMQINQIKPFRGREEENESMVQWEAEALKLRMDRNGKTVHMLTGIDLPLRNIDTIWRGDLGRTGRTIAGMVTPVIKTIPEILLNQDFFLGSDLTRTQSNSVGRMIEGLHTPQPVKNWLGYKKEHDAAGRPKYTFDGRRFTLLFRSWLLSRAVSTSDRQFRDNINGGGVEWQKIMLDTMTGIRAKKLNMTEQMERKMRERVRQLEEVNARRGNLATFTKTFTPKGQR